MADKMVQYNILKREAEANKQLYDGLLQKLKEAGISAGLRSSNIRIVDPALVPTAPSRPNKSRNITLAILVGLVGGVGLALLREYLDNTVKNPDDVETLSRLPSLAVVPAFISTNGARRNRLQKLLHGSGNGYHEGLALLSHSEPQSQISEAFRALRTSLLLSQADHPPQVILVTSALPHEGKTTASVNIGVTLAQLGDKTLLDRWRSSQAGHQPRLAYERCQARRVEFVPGGSQFAGRGYCPAPGHQQPARHSHRAGSAQLRRSALLASIGANDCRTAQAL